MPVNMQAFGDPGSACPGVTHSLGSCCHRHKALVPGKNRGGTGPTARKPGKATDSGLEEKAGPWRNEAMWGRAPEKPKTNFSLVIHLAFYYA